MPKYIKLIFTVLVLGLISTCKEQPVVPPDNVLPGKRDYVWTVDTLTYPGSLQTMMYSLWASSSKDVYVGGHNEAGYGWMFHYNGITWVEIDHNFRKIDVGQIFGFSSNDVWTAGGYLYDNPNRPPNFLDSSVILHYDGTQWKEVAIQRGRGLQGIWGQSPATIFAVGLLGTIYRYDGTNWQRLVADTNIWFSKIGGNANETYLLGYIPNGYTTDHISHEYLLRWNGNSFVLVDSMLLVAGVVPKFGSSFIAAIDGTIYSVGWGGIFIKNDSSWNRILSVGQTFTRMYGTRREHMFACGTQKTLYHFNGIDWKQLSMPGDPTLLLLSVWCTEEEVFVLGEDGYRSYVIHGR